MSNKVKGTDIKNPTYYFFNDIVNIKKFNQHKIKIDQKPYKKYSYLLYWICDNLSLEMHKNLQCKSFVPNLQQSEQIL